MVTCSACGTSGQPGGAKFCAILGAPEPLEPALERLGVECRAVTLELPAEAADVDSALRLADARL